MLTDAQNRDLFLIAVEYLVLIRMYSPEMSASVHRKRVRDLLTFYFWLSQRRVRSLQAVSRDHIDLYTEASVYGQEWATEAPQRLVKYLQHCRENDEELPKEKRCLTRVSRSRLYLAAGIIWPTAGQLHICSHITKRVEKIGLNEELRLPIRDILRLCGYYVTTKYTGTLERNAATFRRTVGMETPIFQTYPNNLSLSTWCSDESEAAWARFRTT